jgi:hypothetical protein
MPLYATVVETGLSNTTGGSEGAKINELIELRWLFILRNLARISKKMRIQYISCYSPQCTYCVRLHRLPSVRSFTAADFPCCVTIPFGLTLQFALDSHAKSCST